MTVFWQRKSMSALCRYQPWKSSDKEWPSLTDLLISPSSRVSDPQLSSYSSCDDKEWEGHKPCRDTIQNSIKTKDNHLLPNLKIGFTVQVTRLDAGKMIDYCELVVPLLVRMLELAAYSAPTSAHDNQWSEANSAIISLLYDVLKLRTRVPSDTVQAMINELITKGQ